MAHQLQSTSASAQIPADMDAGTLSTPYSSSGSDGNGMEQAPILLVDKNKNSCLEVDVSSQKYEFNESPPSPSSPSLSSCHTRLDLEEGGCTDINRGKETILANSEKVEQATTLSVGGNNESGKNCSVGSRSSRSTTTSARRPRAFCPMRVS